jgi:hypothetical protein
MRILKLIIVTLIMIILVGCSFKNNHVSIKKLINGDEYHLIANSTREATSWTGVGGSCKVLPILIPNPGAFYFTVHAISPLKDTILLEYSDDYILIDSISLLKLLKTVKIDFSPKSGQIWYFRDSIEDLIVPSKSILIHQLDSAFSFYTILDSPNKPNWEDIKSPRYYFELFLKDYSKPEDIRQPLWDYVSNLPNDDTVSFIAFDIWEKDILSRKYLSSLYLNNYDTKFNQLMIHRIKKLITSRVSYFIQKPTLSEVDYDELYYLNKTCINNNLFEYIFPLYENKFLSDSYFLDSYNRLYCDSETNKISFNYYQQKLVSKVENTKGQKNYLENVITLYNTNGIMENAETRNIVTSVFIDNWQDNSNVLKVLLNDRIDISDTTKFYNSIRQQFGTTKDSIAKLLYEKYIY